MSEKKDNAGNRGKYAEKKVREFLQWFSGLNADFDFHRILDARSAMGRFPSQPGDFAFYMPRVHGLIEIKEVAHDFRLPHKNFGPEQIGKLLKRRLAGGTILILVYHSTCKLWRVVDFEFLRTRTGGSWDLGCFKPVEDINLFLADYLIGVGNAVRTQ